MQRPPVILLGVDTPMGLAVLRELGERGVPVHGIGRTKQSIGLFSRRLAKGYVRPATTDALVEMLNGISAASGAPFLMTISETDALFARRTALSGGFHSLKPLVAGLEQLQIVNDKAATLNHAADAGVPLPRTSQPQSADDIDALVQTQSYPCILKWADPVAVAPVLDRFGLEPKKFEYCYSPEELTRALNRYVPVGRFPLVQSFVRGRGMGHMLFMYRGDAVLKFRHQRLAEWPPEGGSSTVCRSLPILSQDPLLEKSIALLKRIGWEGAAMVEYRYDSETHEAALMEVNGRFWGSYPLAYHAGAPFAWLTYAILGLGETPAKITPYRIGIECRFMIPETKRLFRVLFRRGSLQDRQLKIYRFREVLRYAAGFLRPKTRYYVFQWRDPLPCLADLSLVVMRGLRIIFARLRRR